MTDRSHARQADRLSAADLFCALDEQRFDDVIDVRSPAEFAEDHIPGAVNLPVLDNDERAEVGTIYVQESKFRARKIGAARVSRNIARHLETYLKDKPGGYRPLVLCWRGGQRSGAMAIVLRQIGWPAVTLEGGYRGYRRQVADALYGEASVDQAYGFRAVLIDGGTGAGKTALLQKLAQRGRAALDLEGLAAHKGSIFGAETDRPQPSQKMFESAVFDHIRRGFGSVVAIEAEASRIGARTTPPALWRAMTAAPAIVLEAPLEARAAHLLADYADIAADPAQLDALLSRLPERHGAAKVAEWRALAAEGALLDLVRDLAAVHYDPAYAKSTRLRGRPVLARIRLERIDEAALEAAADDAEAALDAYAAGLRPLET